MKLTYDDALPISARRVEIAEAIEKNQVVVLAGETGSGKTTQLPKIILGLGRGTRGRIGHTQPRRIAARAVAARISSECGTELGQEVGYAVRFDDQTSKSTVVKLMTDGILLAEIRSDPQLRQYDTIIIDEAHERSLAIDFLLGYLKRLLPRRPDLKLLITSATIDVDRFAAMFDAPVIEVSGRTYPVETRYRPMAEREDGDPLAAIGDAVDELSAESDGDILVFFSGEREIRDTAEYLSARKLRRTEVLPLFGRLSAAEQQRVFSSHSGRRIVLATNVAETSLTVPGIRYVIDPGTARISRYSQRLKVQRLPIEAISQASANQRSGRCGRTSDGICIRLYAEDDFEARPEFTDPEIQRTNLASVLLQMAALDLGDIREFPFLDPPDARAIRDGVELLRELGAVPATGSRLTPIGRKLAALPVDPRLARMLLSADRNGCLADVLVIVSAMSIQDPRQRPLEQQQKADEAHKRFAQPDSDFLSYLTLWNYLREKRSELSHNKFRRLCHDEYLHYLRIREWHDVHSQLRQSAKDLGMRTGKAGSDPDRLHQSLLAGLLSHVGLKDTDGREYAGARNARFSVFPGSGLAKKLPRWIMAGELVETSRLFARTNAKIQPEWIESEAGHLLKRSYSEPHWSAKRAAVMAKEKATLYGLPVVVDRAVNYSSIDPAVSRELFIRHALVQGEWHTRQAFWRRNRALLDELAELEDRVRRRDLRVDDDTLFAFYDARVGAEAVSGRHFDTWWKKMRQEQPDLLDFEKSQLLRDDLQGDLDAEFPHEWHSDGAAFPLTYSFEPGAIDDGVTVDVPIQDLATLDEGQFLWNVPGNREELLTALLKTLPKSLRRNFVPTGDFARRLVTVVDPNAADPVGEMAASLTRMAGVVVGPDSFDPSALPAHLRVTFRILDGAEELSRGQSLDALRAELDAHLRKDLRKAAQSIERLNITEWDLGTLERTVEAGPVTGYPALVDNSGSVDLEIMRTKAEQFAAMIRGEARLLRLTTSSPVSAIGKNLDLRSKLILATGPYPDVIELIEDCHLAALDALVVLHGGPVWNEAAFTALRGRVRADAYGATEGVVGDVIRTLEKLTAVQSGMAVASAEAAADVRVQLSWLVYRGFIRDAGLNQIRRMPFYLEAAARRLVAADSADLYAAQDLEARFHERVEEMRRFERIRPEVQRVRWALEELRLSLFAQHLRTAHPVSVPRVTKLVDALP